MSKLLKNLLMIALTVPAMAMAQVNLDRVVATVAGEPVTAQEVQEQISTNVSLAAQQAKAAGKAFKLTKAQEEEFKQAAFNETIANRLMVNKAKNSGISILDGDVDQAISNMAQANGETADQLKANVIKQSGEKGWAAFNRDMRLELTKGALVKREVDDKLKITPAEVDAFLASKNLGSSNPTPKTKGVEASHIFIDGTSAKSLKKINDAKARLAKGDAFEAVARDVSENPETAPNGGQIPVILFDKSVDPAVIKAVQNAADGSVTDVVKTKNGYHIFKVAKPTELEFSLEDQKKMATEALMQQKYPDAYDAFMKDLMESGKALVEVKP